MKISYNWLKEFVDIKIKPQKLADDLSLFGHEVESIQSTNGDYILDFEITPNRGDCLSILGMAREVAALYNSKCKAQNATPDMPDSSRGGQAKQQFKIQNLNKNIKVDIVDSEICPRFTARIIDGISLKESPKWIRDRLKSYGFRAINNIVDITNYVMIETGQPLHAFDYDKLHADKSGSGFNHGSKQMTIRKAKKDESIITLDGKNRKLDKNDIIMSDGKKTFDLCGIMGGFNSEVDQNTKTIILQGSIFDPILIRRTSKRLKHTTDASYRFERGVDHRNTVLGVNRATELIQQSCENSKVGELIDIKKQKTKMRKIDINYSKINHLIGINLSKEKIQNHLKRLNFKCIKDQVIVPSYREFDVKIWQDVAEEIARIYGYNNLGQSHFKKVKPKESQNLIIKKRIKDILCENGFTECYSYSFADEELVKLLKYNLSNCVKVVNSITPENEYLRSNLDCSLLTAISKNPWAPEINIFEIGKVFQTHGLTQKDSRTNAEEKWQIGIITTSKKAKNIKDVLKVLNINTEIKSADQKVLDYLKIRKKIKYVTIDLDKIKIPAKKYLTEISNQKYKKVSEFPPTIRDLAFIVDKNVDADQIRSQISTISSQILFVELFDEFAFKKSVGSVKKNLWFKKNIAFHIWMQNTKHTMNVREVNKITKEIINKIEKKYQAKLRG